jgi:hypothetical protein
MRGLLRFSIVVLLSTPLFAQQAFETHLLQLQSAIEGHRKSVAVLLIPSVDTIEKGTAMCTLEVLA